VHMAHNISECITIERHGEDKVDPIADGIFDAIDRNGDGLVDSKELIRYMVKEYSTQAAHKLIRVLDTDGDNRISRAEWNTGWNKGLMSELLMKEKPTRDRLATRRNQGPMALTVAAAAKSYNDAAERDAKKKSLGKGASSGAAQKRDKSKVKPDLPPIKDRTAR
jgi:hypothetical protein